MNKTQKEQLLKLRKNLTPSEKILSGGNKYINPIHKPQPKAKKKKGFFASLFS